jgi:signal transduction histidine kinase/ActR/RegA family two-component response regulator
MQNQRLALRIGVVAAAFIVAVLLAAAAVLVETRRSDLAQSDEQIVRAVATAETEFNRTMMAVDLALAGLPQVLAAAVVPGGFDAEAAHAALAALQEQQLLFADLALVDETGQTLTTALRATRRVGPELPAGLVSRIRGSAVATLVVSDPVPGRSTGEPSLLLGRPLDLPGAAPMVALAEVPAALLLPASGATVAGVPGLTLSVEREDGRRLASHPPEDRPQNGPLPAARLAALLAQDGLMTLAGAEGRPERVAARATLYPGLRVVARRAQADALAGWRVLGRWVTGVALLFVALVGVAAWAVLGQFRKLSEARQETAATAGLLDGALEAMGDALLVCDANDEVAHWNARYLELFPWQKTVLRAGVPFRALLERGASERFGPGAEAAAAAWTNERMRMRHAMGEGHTQQQQVHSGVVVSIVERRMPDGGIVSVYHDMTANERQLARAKAEAEAANEAKSQFLANMSHEIRTPLNAVLGLNELLLMSRLDDTQRRHAELVRTSGQLLLALINDILDLSRIEADRFEAREEAFEPGRVAEEVCSLLAERAQAQGLALAVEDSTPAGMQLLGDAVRLRQVLFNLVGNALKFTERGGVTLALSLQDEGEAQAVTLRLAVKDTGIGIQPELMPRLFERFTQADNSATRRHGGSGLGLAITREVVLRLRGRIDVDSTPGKGSTFTVALPLKRLQPAPPPSSPGPVAASRPEPTPPALRVLVAEDNLVNQVLIDALLQHLGHAVLIVGNGREAVERAAAGGVDLVLMDMQMPELDGLAATRRIRALAGAASRLPIVAMTANARPEDRQACLDAGMDDYVAKPIDIEALREAMRRARAVREPPA